MADAARAGLVLVPRIDGLTATIDKQLSSASSSATKASASLGTSIGSGVSGGLAKQGALVGAFSALTNKALDSISSHLGDAASRFDTLNNYPAVMESLGYSADSAQASIDTMSERLSSLPTRLDDMASTVQGIAAVTGDLDQATEAGLALNDMLVASGSSTQLTTSAMEQFRQMLAKGKPEMEDWKSLTSAMPGQMAQLAQSMLGPTATASDLYAALGGGGAEATLTMDDLMEAMVRLDQEGGEGVTSFKEQAETAAGGVQTAMSNMSNAVTKGLAGTMEAVGKENIAGALGDAKEAINDVFSAVNSGVSKAVPYLEDAYGLVKGIAPQLVAAGAGAAGLSKVAGEARSMASRVLEAKSAADAAGESLGALGTVNAALGTSLTPLGVGISVAGAALGLLAEAAIEAAERQEAVGKATTGLSEAVAETGALDGYAAVLDGVGASSGDAALSVDELTESIGKHVDAMAENTAEAEATISQLTTAQGIIDAYAGQTDLSAEAQGKLKWAVSLVNEQLGTEISLQDVANGQYADADGNVQDLTESIDALITKKKEEARVEAVTANLTEAYEAQSEAAKTLAQAQSDIAEARQKYVDMGYSADDVELAIYKESDALATARAEYDSATLAVADLSEELGTAAAATSEAATAWDTWAANTAPLFQEQLKQSGTSIDMLKEDLAALGADTQALGSLSEGQLEQIAADYDGTAESVVADLDSMGVGMDGAAADAARAAADAARAAAEMRGTLEGLAADAGTALEGVDLASFTDKLAQAGVSTADLNAVGSANFAALAQACGGNVDQMVWFLQNYNGTPLVDKAGDVHLDDAELMDAQGNLYTWNGSSFVTQSGQALLDDQQVMDAQGHLYTWNGSNLQYKSTDGVVYDLMSDGIVQRDEWNRTGLNSYEATGTINIFKNITETVSKIFGNAAGGIRPRAAGGVRLHADGAIATKAVPLDIVGEDGAEAIVPLTNRRYSQPFADIIAERTAELAPRGDPGAAVVAWLERNLGDVIAAYAPQLGERDLARVIRREAAYA